MGTPFCHRSHVINGGSVLRLKTQKQKLIHLKTLMMFSFQKNVLLISVVTSEDEWEAQRGLERWLSSMVKSIGGSYRGPSFIPSFILCFLFFVSFLSFLFSFILTVVPSSSPPTVSPPAFSPSPIPFPQKRVGLPGISTKYSITGYNKTRYTPSY